MASQSHLVFTTQKLTWKQRFKGGCFDVGTVLSPFSKIHAASMSYKKQAL